jgi:hypothetical protein
MQLMYTTHHSLLNATAFSPWFSWLIVLGALYGVLHLVVDFLRFIRRAVRSDMFKLTWAAPADEE